MMSFARYGLGIGAAAVLLAGCSALPFDSAQGRLAQDESHPPIGAPGVMTQTPGSASARSAAHRLSVYYQQLYRFRHGHPAAALVNVNGTLYGTTASGYGTVYSITTSGVHKLLYRFRGGSDGRGPNPGRLLNVNGTLYGTTVLGGGGSQCYNSCGTVYSISTSGTEKVLYAFKGGSDGAYPQAGLIDVKGTLYGTTFEGGGKCASDGGCGTVFAVTTSGQETVLHSFAGPSVDDGSNPEASLVDANGTLYGTTSWGGTGGFWGTVFSISTSGAEKVLYNFGGGSDGAHPVASLIVVNGTLYGTTRNGGLGCYSSHSHVYSGCGTVFAVTTSGQETVLHRFGDSGDGTTPDAGLIDVSGTLYGTTFFGGASGRGTVFSITTSGTEQVLHSFAGGSDGANPVASLIGAKGTLYGTTSSGGSSGGSNLGRGTVFALTP